MNTRNAIVGALGLAALLALGFGAVWGGATLWALDIARNLTQGDVVYEDLYIQIDGTPVIQQSQGRRFVERTVRTLEGVPLTEFSPVGAAALAPPAADSFVGLVWQQRLYGFSVGTSPPQFWYFVHDGRGDGRGYFVGYDSESHVLLGYVGKNGGQRDPPTREEQFAVPGRLLDAPYGQFRAVTHDGYHFGFEPDTGYAIRGPEPRPDTKVHLIAGEEVVEVNLSRQSVRPLIKAADAVSVGVTMKLLPETAKAGQAKTETVLVVRGRERLLFVDEKQSERSVPLPEELRSEPLIPFQLHDGTALVRVGRRIPERQEVLYWLGDDAAAQRRRAVPLKGFPAPTPATRWLWLAAGMPSPAALALNALALEPHERVAFGLARDYRQALGDVFAAAWLPLLATTLVAAALAAWVWQRHRRFGGSYGWLWFLFVLVAGWPGVIGYLCHRRWPVLAACPHCGKRAPRDREACMHCARPFPPPAAAGIEVFA